MILFADTYLRTARNRPELLLHNHRLWKRGCGKGRVKFLIISVLKDDVYYTDKQVEV